MSVKISSLYCMAPLRLQDCWWRWLSKVAYIRQAMRFRARLVWVGSCWK